MYYSESDCTNTMMLHNYFKLSSLKQDLCRYRSEYDNCDDYNKKQKIGKKIGRVIREIRRLESS